MLKQDKSLFLDVDGTLLDLIDCPDDVSADPRLRELLTEVNQFLFGRLAIVSGRSLTQLDRIFGSVATQLALAGSHGTEFRWHGLEISPPRPGALDVATDEMRRFAGKYTDVLLEEKSFGVALHYRMAPGVEVEACGLARDLAAAHGLYLQEGKMMVELRPAGYDKGGAIRQMMAESPLAGAIPVFVGDDITDEPGFEAASGLSGYGILAGKPRISAARYHLAHPKAVRDWLKESIA